MALVVAKSKYVASDALALIQVDYDELPAVAVGIEHLGVVLEEAREFVPLPVRS